MDGRLNRSATIPQVIQGDVRRDAEEPALEPGFTAETRDLLDGAHQRLLE
jgi:hypothetical protein